MHKRDYVAIAEVVEANAFRFKSNSAHAHFAGAMADMLAEDNSRFDRERFLAACMPSFMVGTKYTNVWERVARFNSGNVWAGQAMLRHANDKS